MLETDLLVIENAALGKEPENLRFREFLSDYGNEDVDAAVFRLNDTVSAAIDCTSCGNCCRSLMINVSDTDASALSAHLGMTRELFEEKYVEKSPGGRMVVNRIPCHFLEGNRCSVYEHRFSGCREFPALHLPGFRERLFTTFMHYSRCPIIFNVVEGLKKEMGFEQP